MMYEIKKEPDDFVVEEITPRRKVLKVNKKYRFVQSEGDQLICVLQKRNWDAHLALREIARRLRISKKRIGFAGTKDKRAVTTQRISIWNCKKEEVTGLKISDIKIKPIKYSNERVKLGDLWGNRFTVKVYSDVEPKEKKRIVNYFGEQRFGTTRPITHLVGKAIVLSDFEKAVKIYLTEIFPEESDEAKEARKKLLLDWNYSEALLYFPQSLKFERILLSHLAKYENDYIGALRKLPKFLLTMFVGAYQSFLFNKFLDAVVEKGLSYETGPLYGYETEFENELERKILESEGIQLAYFLVKSMPEMSSVGIRRQLFVELRDLEIEKNGAAYTVKFALPKGSYATVAIKQLFG